MTTRPRPPGQVFKAAKRTAQSPHSHYDSRNNRTLMLNCIGVDTTGTYPPGAVLCPKQRNVGANMPTAGPLRGEKHSFYVGSYAFADLAISMPVPRDSITVDRRPLS